MRRFINRGLIVFFILLLGRFVFASPPLRIGYQGFITDNKGVPINGPSSFKFCVANASGVTNGKNLWCHNGNTDTSGEPSNSINVDVDEGYFSVIMGDASTHPNMGDLPSSIFNTSDELYLCIWFQTGNRIHEKLEPCQRFTYNAFAVSALNGGSSGYSGGDLTIDEDLIVLKGTSYLGDLFLGQGVSGTEAGHLYYDSQADTFKACTKTDCKTISRGDTDTSNLLRKDTSDTSTGTITAAGFTTTGATTTGTLTASGAATLGSLTTTGDAVFDTSTLKVDSTNNRVGVGTASPSYPLHVTSSNTTSSTAYIDGTSVTTGNALLIQTDNSLSTGTALKVIYDDANMSSGENVFEIINQDSVGTQTNRFAIRLDGQVTVGGTVLGSTYSGSSAVTVSSASGSDLTLDGGNGSVLIASGDTLGNGTWSVASTGNTTFATGNFTGSVQTGGTTRLTNSGGLQNIASIAGTGALTVASGSGDLTLDGAGGTVAIASGDTLSAGAITGSGNLTINTSDLAVNTSNRMVGIATASPVEKLEVSGGLRAGLAPTSLTTLSAGAGSTDTSLSVTSTSGYASAGTLLIDSEAINYTGTAATSFTGLTRGALGTTAATHNSGATVDNYSLTLIATTSAPRLVVTGAGNLGLGTTAPDEQIQMTGRVHLGQASAPSTTTDKLYNVSGDLYWNGTALSTNGANCDAGSYARGVDASGAAEGCTAVGAGTVTSVATGSGLTGGTITTTGTLSLGALTADWNQTGAYDIVLANASSELKILESAGGTYYGIIDAGDLSADRTYTFPDATGTVALTTSNVATATALAANGANCSAGSYPLGVDASGAVETCTAAGTVTSVDSGDGLTGGAITGSGTLAVGAGSGISVTSDAVAVGPLTADWNQTGAFDITLNNASSELKILESAGATYYGIVDAGDLSADRTYTFPDATGTVALTTSNVATATALAANGANCSAGSYPLGVDASGAVESCTVAGTGTVTSVATGSGLSGGTITSTGTLTLGALTDNWNQTGAYDIVLNNASSEIVILESTGGTWGGTIDVGDLSANRTYTFPDETGTVCTTGSVCTGYQASSTALTTSTSWGGDLTGTGSSPTVADNSVDGTDIALGSDAQGDVMYYSGTDWVRLAAGTSGQYLKTQGAGANPTWADSAAGTMGALTADWGQTGAYDIVLANASSELKILESAGATYYGIIDAGDLSADRTYTFPDATGTVALTTSNVATATALAANGANCSAGSYPLGVDASGAVETCTAATTGTVTSVATGSGLTGGTITTTGTLSLGALTADWNQTGAFDITLNNASSELKILESAGGTYYGIIDAGDLSADRTYTFPDATGTVALTTSNVATATALAANGANCDAGSYPLGVDASGAVESCTVASGSGTVTSVATGSGLTGGTITTTGTLSLGALTADWNQTGAFDIVLNNASSELKILESSGATYYGIIDAGDLSADRTYTFPDVTGTVALTTSNVATATALAANGANCSAGSYPLGVDASGAVESCTAVGGGATAWDDIGDPDAGAAVAMAEYAQTLDWDTASTAAAFDGLTITMTNDAGTDSNTQRVLVITNKNDGGSTGTTERLLVLDNADSNEAVTTGLEIDVSGGGTGSITTGIDLSDTLIGDAINIGNNAIVTGNVAGTIGDSTTDSWTFTTDGTGTAEIVLPAGSIDSTEILDATIAGGDLASTIAITSTGAQDFGGASDFEIPNGGSPTVNVTGEIAIDTTDDQLIYYGASAKRVLPFEYTRCAVIEDLVAADDNKSLGSFADAVTITSIWCSYTGTGSTVATITLEDGSSNAMTHNAPTCTAVGTVPTAQSVTAAGSLTARETVRFDVTNTPNPTTDDYEICISYTIDAQ
ncbi:MAG: hypothetical protein HYS22_01705 [Deltaproteobacteria bacterium]|nr:hypothetical protein [Deltaproteobacteria bacterium]